MAMINKTVYAMYHGEQYVGDGTIPELAAATGYTARYLRWATTKTAHKRCRNGVALVRLGTGEEMERLDNEMVKDLH